MDKLSCDAATRKFKGSEMFGEAMDRASWLLACGLPTAVAAVVTKNPKIMAYACGVGMSSRVALGLTYPNLVNLGTLREVSREQMTNACFQVEKPTLTSDARKDIISALMKDSVHDSISETSVKVMLGKYSAGNLTVIRTGANSGAIMVVGEEFQKKSAANSPVFAYRYEDGGSRIEPQNESPLEYLDRSLVLAYGYKYGRLPSFDQTKVETK